MADRSLYDILGVAKTATEDEIKKSYRKLARKHHPDVNPGDERAEQRFKEIGAAYDVLGDSEKRALYDEFGEDATKLGFDPEKARSYQQWQQQARWHGGEPYTDTGFDQEDLLRDLFGGGRGRRSGSENFRRRPRKGADIHAELTVDFRSAALGGERTLTFSDGRNLAVRIPPGVADGGTIRLRGQGMPGIAGEASGDLRITLHVTPDQHFRRDGLDLHLDVPITVPEAIRGASIRVPTLDGAVDLRVPPGSQTGRTLRLKAKGIARLDRAPGDLYVHLEVHVPTGDSEALSSALDALDSAYTTHPRAVLETR